VDKLRDIIKKAVKPVVESREITSDPDVILEIPKDRKLADLSTNVAMQICKSKKGIKPFEIAQEIVDNIKEELKGLEPDSFIEKVEVKPPGFINFHFSKSYLHNVIKDIREESDKFGRSKVGKNKKVLIEFVSANPTGPLSVAHGRQAAVGDALSNILEFAGFDVKREYYLNDEGNQILLLGKSIHARYCELLGEVKTFPEDGYRGKYIYDIAKEAIDKHKKALIEENEKTIILLCNFGITYILDTIMNDLADFGVHFDNCFSQHKMTKSGKIEKILDEFKKKNLTYDKDGATWFKTTEFADDKDRVLIKSDKSYTYLAPDIAYHKDKYSRGFDILIDILGPDHHGYITRLKAAAQAMGKDADSLSVLIIQLATLSRGGIPAKMSTREGEFITLREVMDEVGKDVARFFFLMRKRDSHLDFDLELAKKESMENPVYYIQYAHARICGILELKEKEGVAKEIGGEGDLKLLNEKEELNVLRILREFPDIIEWTALNSEPHRLVAYLMELASSFHVFYTKHRVISDNQELTAARLSLVEALKIVFSKSLALLGVSCPEKM